VKDRTELVTSLTEDINILEKSVKEYKFYNTRNSIVQKLLKIGIKLDYAFPYIVSLFLIYNDWDNHPFVINVINDYANVKTIDTSSGIHLKYSSYDYEYDINKIEYSTGWELNDNGLFERVVTSYRNDDDFTDNEIILMNKSNLDELLTIIDIKTIEKNNLSIDDNIYMDDAVIITCSFVSDEEYVSRKETLSENFSNTFAYLLLSFIEGILLDFIYKVILQKKRLRYKLKDLKKDFPIFDNDDQIEELKIVVEVKKQNLSLIRDDEDKNDEAYQYTLRK